MRAGDAFASAGASGFCESRSWTAHARSEKELLAQVSRGSCSRVTGLNRRVDFPPATAGGVLLLHVSCIILETHQTEAAPFSPKKPGLTCA